MGQTLRVTRNHQDDEPDEEFLTKAQPFETREEMLEALRKPEYKTNPFYHQAVKRCLELTDPSLFNIRPSEAAAPTIPAMEAKIEASKKAFRDPRYRTDPQYRLEVAQKISENSPNIAPEGKTARVGFSTDPTTLLSHQGFGCLRVEFAGNPTGFDKPERKPVQSKDDNSIDLGAEGFGDRDK